MTARRGLLFGVLLSLLLSTPCPAADIAVTVISAYAGAFRFEFYQRGKMFDSTTVVFKYHEQAFVRLTTTVPEPGCGYTATVVPLATTVGGPQTAPQFRPLRMKEPGACVSGWQVGWFAKNLGHLTFTDSAPHKWTDFPLRADDTDLWLSDHPWFFPLLGVGLVSLIVLWRTASHLAEKRARAKYVAEHRRKYGKDPPDSGWWGLVEIIGEAIEAGGKKGEQEKNERQTKIWQDRVHVRLKEALVWWTTERMDMEGYVRAHRDEILAREADIRSAFADPDDPCFTVAAARTAAEYALAHLAGDVAYYLREENSRTVDVLTDVLRRYHGREMEIYLPRAKALAAEEKQHEASTSPLEQELEEWYAIHDTRDKMLDKLHERCREKERQALADGLTAGEALVIRKKCEQEAERRVAEFFRAQVPR